MESVLPYVLAIVPTIGMGTLFYFVIKSILEGDRRERLAQARWEAEQGRPVAGGHARTRARTPGTPGTDAPQAPGTEPPSPPAVTKER